MNTTEFRIGNLLQDAVSKTPLKVVCLTETGIETYVIDRSKFPLPNGWKAEPIPLTEEWMLKLGFEKYDEKTYTDNTGFILNKNENGTFEISIENTFADMLYAQTPYVHTFQNLYFALTGEELRIQEPQK